MGIPAAVWMLGLFGVLQSCLPEITTWAHSESDVSGCIWLLFTL